MKRWFALFLTACMSVPAAAQHPEDSPSGPPVLSSSELVVRQFRPTNLSAVDVYRTVSEMVGRWIYIEERGGARSEPIENVRTLSDVVVVYDTAAYAKKVLEMCEVLDATAKEEGSSVETHSATYEPRYLELESVKRILSPLLRQNYENAYNVSFVEGRNLVILRDTSTRVAEMLELLERNDRPQQQVLVTCYLLQGYTDGSRDASSSAVPKALSDHLSALVPGMQFDRTGFAVLQTSAVAEGLVRLKLGGSNVTNYSFQFVPVAFDGRTGSLSVERCSLTRFHASSEPVEVFTTSTVLRGEEYTVLGASGADPIFLAVRVAPLEP